MNTLVPDILRHIYKILVNAFDQYALLSTCKYFYEILFPKYASLTIGTIVLQPYIREFLKTNIRIPRVTYLPVDNELYAICMAIKIGGGHITTHDRSKLDIFVSQFINHNFMCISGIRLPHLILDINDPENSAIISDIYPAHRLYPSNKNHIYIGDNYHHRRMIHIGSYSAYRNAYYITDLPILEVGCVTRSYVKLEENLSPIVNTTEYIYYNNDDMASAISKFIKLIPCDKILFINCMHMMYNKYLTIEGHKLNKNYNHTHIIYKGSSDLILPGSPIDKETLSRRVYHVLWIKDPIEQFNKISKKIINTTHTSYTVRLILRSLLLSSINFFKLDEIEQKIILDPKMLYFDEWKNLPNKVLTEEQVLKILL